MSVALTFRATDAAAQAVNSNSMNWTITAAGDPVAIAIVNAVVAWWDFEENSASTTFLDSKNSNHLTVVNSGGTAPTTANQSTASGLIGRGMQNENAETSRTALIPRSNTNLDLPNTNWSFGGWFKMPGSAFGSTRFIMGRLGDGSPSNLQAYFAYDSVTGFIDFVCTVDGVTQVKRQIVAVSPSFWYLFVGTFDRTNNVIRGRAQSLAPANVNVTTAFPGALYTTANDANFCIWDAYAADTSAFAGSRCPINATADSCFYMNKAITDAEFAMLYNAGVGLNYAQLLTLAGM